MKSNNIFNAERVNALYFDKSAYITQNKLYNSNNQPINRNNLQTSRVFNQNIISSSNNNTKVNTQVIEKVLFPEPYQNSPPHYNNHFEPPPPPPPPSSPAPAPMFDIKNLLPMLMSGKADFLKPIMSLFTGGGAGADVAKIFDIFKSKPKKTEVKEEKSKFEDMIIVE